MFTALTRACLAAAVVAASGTQVSVFAQPPAGAPQQTAPTPAPAPVRRLAVEDAVRLAAENNLGLTIARVNPLLEDIAIAQVRAAWSPSLNSSFIRNSTVNQNTGFLSGASGTKTTNARLNSDLGVVQALPWGGNYSLGWSGSRSTSNSLLDNFSPQLRSGLAFSYSQSLLRNFKIDSNRQQLMSSVKQREIADVQLRQTLAATMRTVRNVYWDLAYAIASLRVQQQSLDLARESLRNTRARIEIGTLPPIDEIEPEAEVAQREEAVITAESNIGSAEDLLRALIFNANEPDFWAIRIEPTELPKFELAAVDTDMAVRNALDRRSDLLQSKKSLEQSDITIRYLRDQTLPEVNADIDYSVSGVGGTQLIRNSVIGGDVIGQSQRSFGAVMGDLFTNSFPTWTAALTIRYPLGKSAQEASLARARLQVQPDADANPPAADAGHDAGPGRSASGDDEPEARGDHTAGPRVRGAKARRRAAQARRGHANQLLRAPGPARPGAGAEHRAQRHPRLCAVRGRSRHHSGDSARRRRRGFRDQITASAPVA